MNDLACPSCHWVNEDAARGDVTQCPMCGTSLCVKENVEETELVSREDEALVAQLREAFGSGSRGLGARSHRIGVPSGKRGAASPGPTESLSPGSRFADFEIISEIGRGGMGVVYRARQISLDRPIALKVMTGARRLGPTAAERFHREARAAARLNHANVVPVYAQGAENDTHYYAMKLVEGVSLDTAIQSRPELLSSTHHLTASSKRAVERLGPLPAATASSTLHSISASPPPGGSAPVGDAPVRRSLPDYRYMATLLVGAAEGLAHAHQAGVVHRDIKPHNLILGDDWQLHLTDFGLAYIFLEPHLTLSGEVMGTPAYLSPEQVRGNTGDIDHRTDIYSLGVTLYEMITNHRPFEFESRDQVLHAITSSEPRRPRQWAPAIPRDLETICLRAMEKEPSRRYPTAEDLATDLRRFGEGRPILSRRAGPVERSFKWARRHRSLTAAIIAVAAVFFATAGWSMSVAAANHREGDSILHDAYERLVYQDYQEFEDIVPQIDRAEVLGADPSMLSLLRSLVNIGKSENPAAIARLQSVVAAAPDQRDWQYLLAWAMWRDRRRDEALRMVKTIDASGGPLTADGWFFRAMAVNHFDAEDAIRSHRQAIALRVAQNEFFPQAGLNLARAYNQLMYSRRMPDGFTESEPILRQLVKDGYYKARPHYLLSIAHRLAGEIYAHSSGTRPGTAEDHFDQALLWADAGIQKDPTSDRPVTARAECLERLGRWDEAVAARTAALALAKSDMARCEAYHYRWRLYYWLSDYDHALADIDKHNSCVQNSWYKHVYRALIHADRGDLSAAHAEAFDIYADEPASADAVILASALLRAFGHSVPDDLFHAALAFHWDDPALDANSVPGWKRALIDFIKGDRTLESLAELAATAEKPYRLTAESDFYAGLLALGRGDRDTAIFHFTNSHKSFDSEAAFSYHARVLLQKMLSDPSWPQWLPRPASESLKPFSGSATSP